MIGYFCGEDKAGIYGIAYTMSAVVNIVWNSINATLVPTIYQRCDDGRRSTLSRLIVPIIAGYGGVCTLIMLLSTRDHPFPGTVKLWRGNVYYSCDCRWGVLYVDFQYFLKYYLL